MHFVIAVYPSHAYNIYALHSSQTFHQTNYRQIVYSSVDPDQMAFGIQKEINLGYTRLNCYHYYWSVYIVIIRLLSYNNAWNILMK